MSEPENDPTDGPEAEQKAGAGGEPKPGEGSPEENAAPSPGPGPGARPIGGVPKRTAEFRRALLAKLPRLGYRAWSVKNDFNLDEEWGAALNLHADALLEPLQAIAPDRLKS